MRIGWAQRAYPPDKEVDGRTRLGSNVFAELTTIGAPVRRFTRDGREWALFATNHWEPALLGACEKRTGERGIRKARRHRMCYGYLVSLKVGLKRLEDVIRWSTQNVFQQAHKGS